MMTSLKSKSTFQIPDNYFSFLPRKILESIKAANTDEEIGMSISVKAPFLLPEETKYFATLPEIITTKAMEAESIINGSTIPWGKEKSNTPYYLNPDYFNKIEENLLFAIRNEQNPHEEIKSIAPILAEIKNKTTLEIPENYFAKTIPANQIRVKKVIHPAVKSIRWGQWVVAASMLLIFSLGAFRFLNIGQKNKQHFFSFQELLTSIPDATIEEFLIQDLDEYEISELGENYASINSIKVFHRLQQFSDEELAGYLGE